jgi:hypothetical protein
MRLKCPWPLHFKHSSLVERDETKGPCPLQFKHSSLVGRAKSVQVCSTLRLRDQRSKWMQDGRKVYMDTCMTSNGLCFMVTCTIYKNHLLEVGLTQNRETMVLRNPTTVDLLHFIFNKCEDPAWIELHWNSIWLRAWSHKTSQYT